MTKRISFLLCFMALAICSMGQKKDKKAVRFAATIQAGDLSKHLHILASDSFRGRETGELGQKLAADYIAKQFARLGLTKVVRKGDSSSYFQSFELEKRSWGSVSLTINGLTRTFLKDFYPARHNKVQQAQNAPLVFAGYGIADSAYNEYTNLDVKGKAVIILGGEPTDSSGHSLLTKQKKLSEWADNWRKKVAAARLRGARACLVVPYRTNESFKRQLTHIAHYLEQPAMGFAGDNTDTAGIFFISPALAAEALFTSEQKLYDSKQHTTIRQNMATAKNPATLTYQSAKIIGKVQTENVLGLVEGTTKKDEVIVITAHYDHIGVENDTVIYNGADDDGSGTSAVLEMAEAFALAKKQGKGPKRSILFMTVTGEEKGLLGSEYYVNHPIFPLGQTVANLNIDMIGRLDEAHKNNPNYVYLIGADKLSTTLDQIASQTNKTYSNLTLDYTFNSESDPNRFYYRSDHYNFAKNNVPVVFYFTGVHEDYHKPTDTVEKIMFSKMELITRYVFHTAWELANRNERIKVDKTGGK